MYSCSKSASDGGNTPVTTTPPVKKIVVPIVDIAQPSNVINSSAESGGNVVSDGGAAVTARGICWSTSQNPTVANSKTADSSGTGLFNSVLTGLTVNTTYYIRAYATNSVGTGYSEQMSFTTAFQIAQSYQGGLVFFIDATTLHGLIVTAEDQGDAPWENTNLGSYYSAGAYSASDGDANTTLIIKKFGNAGNAAAMAKACRDGGYKDWFLPSSYQLATLFSYQGELYDKSTNGLSASQTYWSSTEDSGNIAWAVATPFQYGDSYFEVKTISHSVRAIRAF